MAKAKRYEDIVEELSERWLEEVDRETLDARLTLAQAAAVCRDLAGALRARARQLDDEAAAGVEDI